MKSVLISIRPKWCELIASGKKTVEVRKTMPKIETPFKCYIYETQSNVHYSRGNGKTTRYFSGGKVIGEFVCDEFYAFKYYYSDGVDIDDDLLLETTLGREEINTYASGKPLYGWHISDLVIYDKPIELIEFRKVCKYRNDDGSCRYLEIDCDCKKYDFNPDGSVNLVNCVDYIGRPPQSWCYVEEIQ